MALLGEPPSLTRQEVADRAGVPLAVAMELWRLSGFPHAGSDEVAFTSADVDALRLTGDLMRLGVLSADRQAALVRTWARSFARLAEWQTSLLASVARERGAGDGDDLLALAAEVLPRVESLQTYMWRRHLASAASRALTPDDTAGDGDEEDAPVTVADGGRTTRTAICFIDIVGYTARSKELTEQELVAWVEGFEQVCAGLAVDHGGRIIKSLGDAVLLSCDTAAGAAAIALEAVRRGEDEADPFPPVRAGLAYGPVVTRLGDVFGPTVNIASRLTSHARRCTVLGDEGAADQLGEDERFRLQRLRRTSVKGYSKLQPYLVRPVG